MRIAIVGSGSTGLSAARVLGEDPRHVITVFETHARFGGRVGGLFRLGVTLRCRAQVERLAVDVAGADLWVNGLAERFDLALVATSSADARELLARSGIRRCAESVPLRQRVYFAEHSPDAARSALVRMAADHPALGPLAVPVIYIANQRWVLDAVLRAESKPGASLAFVVEASLAAREAARAALAVNAPIVPVAAPHARAQVVIGQPFYPETSSIDELIGDMRAVIRHLERLAVAHGRRPALTRGRSACARPAAPRRPR